MKIFTQNNYNSMILIVNKTMYLHIENAIDALLKGLQSISHLIGISNVTTSDANKKLNEFEFFISMLCNLTEALNVLRSDADSELKQRGMQDY